VSNVLGVLSWQACVGCSRSDSREGMQQCGCVVLEQDGNDVVCINFDQTDVPPESMDKEESDATLEE